MTTREQLLAEIEKTPDFLLDEVLDFLLFTRTRRSSSSSQFSPEESPDQPQVPIWEEFETFADQLPDAIAETLPVDGAAQIDHYVYGAPKRET